MSTWDGSYEPYLENEVRVNDPPPFPFFKIILLIIIIVVLVKIFG